MPNINERYLKAKRALFNRVYASLNDEQRAAVFAVNNPLLVIAGAGSGKTTVLVKRIAFIIRYGNAYESNYVPFDITEGQAEALEQELAQAGHEMALLRVSAEMTAIYRHDLRHLRKSRRQNCRDLRRLRKSRRRNRLDLHRLQRIHRQNCRVFRQ